MKCIILAAGYATRLYPLTENYPKPLLPVGGRPILDWLVEDVQSAGVVDEFIVVSNHKYARHFHAWADGCMLPITVLDDGTENNESRMGAVRDMRLAAERIRLAAHREGSPGPNNNDCLVLAGDNLLTFSIAPFIEYAMNAGTSFVMCHEERRLDALQKTAVITVDSDFLITSYEEKPVNPRGHLAVPPFYYFKAADILRIDEALADGCGFDAPGSFAAWLSKRVPMHAWLMPGRRFDIGDIQSYEAMKDSYRGYIS